jgi:hypothetical protein
VRIPFVPRFRAIHVDDGRINFKRGDEKLPFAFIGVSGAIYADGPQRWRLDLEATPWRAAELLQQAGTIHLAGSVGGTSSALQPANLQISWTDASLSDFLRLMSGDDSGVRGTLAIALNAQSATNGWGVQGQAQLGQLHRWDLTVRPDAPSLSVKAQMALDVPASTLEVTEASIDAAHSNAQGSGKISWAAGAPGLDQAGGTGFVITPRQTVAAAAEKIAVRLAPKTSALSDFEVKSASIDLGDALSWLRAFRPNIPEGVNVTGTVQAHGNVRGWPAHLTDLTAQTTGASISGGAEAPLRVGATRVEYDRGAFQMLPAVITLGGSKDSEPGSFRVEMIAAAKHSVLGSANAGLHVAGSAPNAGDVIALANAFGWDIARGWQLAGPLHCDLRWPELEWPWKARPVGSISIGGAGGEGASLRAPFLNLPMSGLQFRMDWKPGARHITLAAAQAFGAHWTGTFDRTDAAPQWQFDLSADRLTAADLDRWLNPRWRESFIDRMLPFLNSAPPTAVPDTLRGEGLLNVDEFSASPFTLQNLSGSLTLSGRAITLDDATAQFFGGNLAGSINAKLDATPDYRLHANFSGVDIAALTSGAHPDAATLGGTASGNAELSMQGTSRSDFAESLECSGALNALGATWQGVALVDSLEAGKLVPGDSTFAEASGQFACASGGIALNDMVLTNARAELHGSGTVDFARTLHLQMRVGQAGTEIVGPTQYTSSAAAKIIQVSGTIAAPEFSKVPPSRRPR